MTYAERAAWSCDYCGSLDCGGTCVRVNFAHVNARRTERLLRQQEVEEGATQRRQGGQN